MIIPASRGIARISHLAQFLEGEGDCVAGWGMKPSGFRAQEMAAKRHIRCLLLEDGFLRSIGRNDPPLSLIVDELGVYYDAGAPSRVEQCAGRPITPEEAERARSLIKIWRMAGVSKYNHAPDCGGQLPHRYVLVIDQTFNDAAIRYGRADEKSFARMLQAALDENPDCTVLLKVHPDIFTHGKTGYFNIEDVVQNPRIQVLAEECHAVRLIREAEAIYAVTSQIGFEGLLWGKTVRCFGMPFYAGWSLTEDDLEAPARRKRITLEKLVHAALIDVPRYVDPETGEHWSAEQAVAFAGDARRQLETAWKKGGFTPSKPPWTKRLLQQFSPGGRAR